MGKRNGKRAMTNPYAGHPCIPSGAMPGSVPIKANNPAVPISILMQIENRPDLVGGQVRTGLHDFARLDRHRDRPVADWRRARKISGL